MIKLHLASNGEFYFTVCGKNGKVLATSETYKEKRKAVDALGTMCGNVILACNLPETTVDNIEIRDLTGENA